MTQMCANCGLHFQPRPQVPNQAYCSAPECQRARKLRWQQDKLRNDPDYRESQRDAQRAWLDRNPGYWANYRARQSQAQKFGRSTAVKDTTCGSAKLDMSLLPAGLYRLRQIAVLHSAAPEGWLVELTPVFLDCPCKKDVCKEKT